MVCTLGPETELAVLVYRGIKQLKEGAILVWPEMDRSRSAASGHPNALPPERITISSGCPQDSSVFAQAGAHLSHYVPHPGDLSMAKLKVP